MVLRRKNESRTQREKSPLSINRLNEKDIPFALELVQELFKEDLEDTPGIENCFAASIQPGSYRDLLKNLNIKRLEYWVAHARGGVSKEKERVGITGLYELAGDPKKSAWIGWYAIDPKQKSKGYGNDILSFTVAKAREGRYRTLSVYTSDHPAEAAALALYQSHGFAEYKREPVPGRGYSLVYLRKDLTVKDA